MRLLAAFCLLLLAGCAWPGPDPSPAPQASEGQATGPGSPAAPEAIDLRWGTPVRVASSGPAIYLNSLAEASATVLPDGTVVVTASGCDKGLPHAGAEPVDLCRHSPVFRSRDGGATWQRLNRGEDSRLADAPAALADSVVRSDAAGRLYYMSMRTDIGLQVLRSEDAGDSWAPVAAPPSEDPDRPWLAAAGDGQLAATWWEGATLSMASSLDGGETWTKPARIAPDGLRHGGIRIVEATGEVFAAFLAQPVGSSIKVAHGHVGSGAWEVLDTGIELPTPAPLGQPQHIQTMPGLAIAADGTMLLTWDEEGHGTVVTATRGYAIVKGSLSRDGGRTWSEPFQVGPYNSIMAWPEALPDGSFVVGYYASTLLPGDHAYVGSWTYDAVQVRQVGDRITVLEPKVVDPLVRAAGGICTGGGDCLTRGADRSFLDMNELATGPDGQVYAAYGAEDLGNAKASTIRVAAAR